MHHDEETVIWQSVETESCATVIMRVCDREGTATKSTPFYRRRTETRTVGREEYWDGEDRPVPQPNTAPYEKTHGSSQRPTTATTNWSRLKSTLQYEHHNYMNDSFQIKLIIIGSVFLCLCP